jgi:hypothetical protein
MASAIVSWITSTYTIKRAKIKAIIDRWGLVGIYETRGEMNIYSDRKLETLSSTLDIIAFGLKSFRDSKSRFVEDKVRSGVKIRILTMNPHGEFVSQREKEENESPGSIKQSIENLAEWVEHLKKIAPDKNDVQLKYYNSMTEDFYFCIDNKYLYTGPYLNGKGSQQTISYEYKKRRNAKLL